MIAGTLAVAATTWLEAWRGRLWLVPLGAGLLLWALAPFASAADPADAVRLLAAATAGAAGASALLIGILVPAAQLTRDLESRVCLTLYPKPLPRLGWLLGRWLGAVALAGAAAAAVALAGSAATAWRAGGMPQVRTAAMAQSFERLTRLGEAMPVADSGLRLAGASGDGVRWRFAGLDPAGQAGFEVLVQARVRASDGGMLESTPVRLAAIAADGAALPLAADPATPFGRPPSGTAAGPGMFWLVDRPAERRSLSADFARLRLPPGAIAADGTLVITLLRLDPGADLGLAADGCLLSLPAGAQPLHALAAAAAETAAAALVAALALSVAAIASLPVAILAGLAAAFAGHALWAVRESLAWEQHPLAVTRLLDLGLAVLPDLSAGGQAARMAAGEAVDAAIVVGAWLPLLPHLAAILLLGWWALARRQL